MAQSVKLSDKWVNTDRIGVADDDGTTGTLQVDLHAGTGRITHHFRDADAETLRGVLNMLAVNGDPDGAMSPPMDAAAPGRAIAEAVAAGASRRTPTEEFGRRDR